MMPFVLLLSPSQSTPPSIPTPSALQVTSVSLSANGNYVLFGCKDNVNRLWDLRKRSVCQRFKVRRSSHCFCSTALMDVKSLEQSHPPAASQGHCNTSKNFIRCHFVGVGDPVVVGGSEVCNDKNG